MSSDRNVCVGSRVSDRQKELLLAFVKEHPQIATLSCPLEPSFTREDRDDMWQELVALLNEEVPARNTRAQWQARWRNERYYSQQGLAKLRGQQSGTRGGQISDYRGRVVLDRDECARPIVRVV
ncbi:uncharacterized protein LOC125758727 [Rhipicephalus sanguineus]|uniref:uncharacterized protein LOC125756804 n=1 Tax=Rhipicephalus sanguineus TaxID=34632 RepID=UPI0020C4CF07|nr:uncharacterized protein LOC125756804 [Rhipicephalus sanguineus]XP_049268638.1 uncharacterized protein LOC125757248 [Rhipicephalus sanguineus]XP_049270422.1 uncharacterized protein LOC125758013 [Rhipicephalus sanguineus]XP_049271793.1 uncharacterized protein LOC125758511 [Rhipicephalus sanguineus]XP_049272275.1 uncharacterized protein LOC125758727 [Rhipicephalus sanguineus]